MKTIMVTFKKTNLYHFINNYVAKEMFSNKPINNLSSPLVSQNNYSNNDLLSLITENKKEPPKEYPHINERLQEIKKRVKKLQERR